MSNIREAIQSIANTKKTSFQTFLAKILTVNEAELTCDVEPLSDEADVFDVRYSCQLSASAGFFAIPLAGSIVLVTMIDDSRGVVTAYSAVTSISLVCDGQDNGGLVKVDYLFEQLKQIQTSFAQLNILLTTHTHAVAAGVASPSPTLASLPSAGTTIKANLFNPKVKH